MADTGIKHLSIYLGQITDTKGRVQVERGWYWANEHTLVGPYPSKIKSDCASIIAAANDR